MKSTRSYRLHLGPRFNEGARRLWAVVERPGSSQARVLARLKSRTGKSVSGLLPKWLYGDRVPEGAWRGHLNALFRIPFGVWDEPPLEQFVPPAARASAGEAA